MTINFRLAIAIFCVLLNLGGCETVYQKTANVALDVLRQRSGLVQKEIDVPGGLHFAYLEGGQGEPLVLLHGIDANKDHFTFVAHTLTPHYHVIVPDLIGFGESTHFPEADYTAAAQVERLRAFVQALGIKTMHLGGNSMGGYVALSYAAHYPTEVASLWLLDPYGVQLSSRGELEQIIESTGHNPIVVKNQDDLAAITALSMSDPPFLPLPILNVLEHELMENHVLEERIFKQFIADPLDAQIAGLTTPTLIVWGEEDRFIPVGTAENVRKLMPRSQLIVMPRVGHIPMLEQPSKTGEDYLRFRASLSAPTLDVAAATK